MVTLNPKIDLIPFILNACGGVGVVGIEFGSFSILFPVWMRIRVNMNVASVCIQRVHRVVGR